jgi:hypothetical protein
MIDDWAPIAILIVFGQLLLWGAIQGLGQIP